MSRTRFLPAWSLTALLLVVLGCGAAESSRKADSAAEESAQGPIVKSTGDRRTPTSVDVEKKSSPDPAPVSHGDDASEARLAEEEAARQSRDEERRRVEAEARNKELLLHDPVAPEPSLPPVDAAPTADIEAAESGGGRRRREPTEFEGDTWEAETPRERLEDLVSELNELLDDAREGGYQQRVPGGSGLSCTDVCNLSQAICTSSGKICTIATSYPTEGWFQDRCQWSKKECQTAGQQCRACSG